MRNVDFTPLYRSAIGFDRLFDANELIENVEAVTSEDIRLFAESIARSANPAVAIVGCGGASTDIARETLALLAA